MIGRKRSGYGTIIMRRRALAYVLSIGAAVTLVGLSIFLWSVYDKRTMGRDASHAMRDWKSQNYEGVYASAQFNLKSHPLSAYWLVLNGASAYQLAVAQVSQEKAAFYIDSSIDSLRKALLVGAGPMDSRARYLLGKAYFRKGPEFADSAVSFLEQAKADRYDAPDLAEHLGLAYASLKEYKNSVAAFSQALGEHPTDLLLLSIARSYLELGDADQARAYAMRCIDVSKDVFVKGKAFLVLGAIERKKGDASAAEKQFLASIDQDDKNPDAYYYLGELYADGGDAVKSRAEWRKALRLDPNHLLTRAKLGM